MTIEPEGTVFVVDDDAKVRESLGWLFDSVSQRFRMFSNAKEFLDGYDTTVPGCLVLDVRMPGMSGVELHKRLVQQGIAIPVIIISGHGDIPMATDAMRRGAIDFLQKPVSPQQLLDRVQQAMEQDRERRRASAEHDSIAARLALLSSREHEVVSLAVTGLTNRQIASRFGVSPQAIDAHRAKALRKMHANNVPELVKLMLRVNADPAGSPTLG